MEELMQTDDGKILWYNKETHTYQEVEVLGELNRENPQLQSDLNMSVTIDDEPQENTSIAEQKPRSSAENTTHLASPCIKSNVWDKNQTLLLLDLCEVHKVELNSPKFKKTEIYKVISSKMMLQGHQFSAEQIANRRKTLITKFKEIKDHNSRTGNDPKEWPYYDIMANYLDERPGISPPASCSSISKSRSSYIPPAQTAVSDKASQPGTSQEKSSEKENVSKKRKVHARSSPRTEMFQWLKEYKRDVERREERRLELAQQQHTKTTSVLKEILTLLKDKE